MFGIRSLHENAGVMLQTVILEHGVPGAELLAMRSPIQSPGEGTTGATPLAIAQAQTDATLPQPLPHPFPAAVKPPESPTPQPASLSQFQSACAALVAGNPHAESGSTSSPLALCAAAACEPPAKAGGRAYHPPANCNTQSGFSRETQSTAQAPGGGARSADVGNAVIGYSSQQSVASAARAAAIDKLRSMAVPLLTPQRSAQHARAHVATPVDLQKLLQGGVDARRQPPHPDAHATLGFLGARWPVDGRGACEIGPTAALHASMQSVAKAGDEGGVDLGSALSAMAFDRQQERHANAVVDWRAGDVFRAGWMEHGAAGQTQQWLDGVVGVGASGAEVPQCMDNQAGIVASIDVCQAVALLRCKESAEAGRLASFRVDSVFQSGPPGSGDVRSAVGTAGQLGAGACIPAPRGIGVAGKQPTWAQEVPLSAAAARVGMDPNCALPVAPSPLRQDVATQDEGAAGQQHSTAVQSLWLWAGVYGCLNVACETCTGHVLFNHADLDNFD